MDKPDRSLKTPAWHLVTVGVLSLTIVGIFYVAGAIHFKESEWDEFGSYIGGAAGVLLTTLTFLALLYTIYIQSSELRLSRQELRLTRDEMKLNREEVARSAEALTSQVEAINIQTFERTLFDSLRFLNDVVYQLEYKSRSEDKPSKGRLAFRSLYSDLSMVAGINTDDGDALGSEPVIVGYMEGVRPYLAVFFRTLYNIYKYLDESPYKNRKYYSRIIRAQIDDYALPIIFYNSLTERGLKFQKYIVDYNILDNMPNLFPNGSHAQILSKLPTPKARQVILADSEPHG